MEAVHNDIDEIDQDIRSVSGNRVLASALFRGNVSSQKFRNILMESEFK